MKKYIPLLVVMVVIATLVLAVEGYAKGPKWILYDNFNSGEIDSNLWTIDSSSADISIEEGRAKFVHIPGNPNDSAWLGIKVSPQTVKGIKAKVTVESCTGDVRARIGGFIGMLENKFVWIHLGLEGGIASPRIFGGLAKIWDPPYFLNSYELFYGQFMRPLSVIGNTFDLTMTFSENKAIYEVDDLGEIEHKLPENLSPLTYNYFMGIGTRSTNGDGPCVVYFDDVYVLR